MSKTDVGALRHFRFWLPRQYALPFLSVCGSLVLHLLMVYVLCLSIVQMRTTVIAPDASMFWLPSYFMTGDLSAAEDGSPTSLPDSTQKTKISSPAQAGRTEESKPSPVESQTPPSTKPSPKVQETEIVAVKVVPVASQLPQKTPPPPIVKESQSEKSGRLVKPPAADKQVTDILRQERLRPTQAALQKGYSSTFKVAAKVPQKPPETFPMKLEPLSKKAEAPPMLADPPPKNPGSPPKQADNNPNKPPLSLAKVKPALPLQQVNNPVIADRQKQTPHQESADVERLVRERREQIRLAEMARMERLAQLKAEQERAAALQAARERDKLERERQVAEKARRDQLAREELAKKEMQERLARQKAEQERAERAAAAAAQAAREREKEAKAKALQQEKQKGLAIPSVKGDLKLIVVGQAPRHVTIRFREFRANRRNKPFSLTELKHRELIAPIAVDTGNQRHEFTVEKAREGVYALVLEFGAGGVAAKISLVIHEGSGQEVKKELGRRSVGLQRLVVKILMPDGILWDDESAFSGSMEDSDSVTRFNSDSGLVWKELNDE